MNKPRTRKLLITGCGASGTRGITSIFIRGQHPMGHENVRVAGMASWFVAAGDTKGDRPRGLKGAYGAMLADLGPNPIVLHQVRYPLHTISTVQRFQGNAWNWIRKYCPEVATNDKIHNCMLYWYHWSMKAEAMASWTYRIESLRDVWPEWCERVQHPEWIPRVDELWPIKAKLVNSKKSWYRPLSWKELEKTDAELTEKIRDLGRWYGYEIP